MATRRALDDLERLRAEINAGRPVYFLCDMYCEVDLQGTATPPLCIQILERFALSPVAEETLNDRTYILYRLAAAAVTVVAGQRIDEAEAAVGRIVVDPLRDGMSYCL